MRKCSGASTQHAGSQPPKLQGSVRMGCRHTCDAHITCMMQSTNGCDIDVYKRYKRSNITIFALICTTVGARLRRWVTLIELRSSGFCQERNCVSSSQKCAAVALTGRPEAGGFQADGAVKPNATCTTLQTQRPAAKLQDTLTQHHHQRINTRFHWSSIDQAYSRALARPRT